MVFANTFECLDHCFIFSVGGGGSSQDLGFGKKKHCEIEHDRKNRERDVSTLVQVC